MVCENNKRGLAPIALFAYRRLNHLERTIEALKANDLAAQSELYIFCDGAKSADDFAAVEAVRQYVETIDGFARVTKIFQRTNLGLSNSIIGGVSKIVSARGRVIVVEDDIVTSPYFLRFMNEGLGLYENELSVASIDGYVYPVEETLPETFFLRGAGVWGWATWKRAWTIFEPNGKLLLQALKERQLETLFDLDNSYGFTEMLRVESIIEHGSWDIHWHASAFLAGMLNLHPGRSLVENIGIDGTGEHRAVSQEFATRLSLEPISIEAIPVRENPQARQAIIRHLRRASPRENSVQARESSTELVARLRQLEGSIAEKDAQLDHMTARYIETVRRAEAIEAATLWKVSYPLRRLMTRWPLGLRRAARTGSKFVWWSLTLRLPSKLRQRHARTRILSEQPPSESQPIKMSRANQDAKAPYELEGPFPSWEVAASHSDGWDSPALTEKALDAALKVRDSIAEYQQDSVIMEHIVYSSVILVFLILSLAKQKEGIRIIDFGGGLGTNYYQNRKILRRLTTVDWRVVERPIFTELGLKHLQTHELSFSASLDEALSRAPATDALLFSGSLQCVENPFELLDRAAAAGIETLALDRVIVGPGDTHALFVQRPDPTIYPASIPCWCFSRSALIATIEAKGFSLLEYFPLETNFGGTHQFNHCGMIFVKRQV
jgi:putative methyltransferase (TIGR04325 family)